MAYASAIGRGVKLFPADFGKQFVHDLAQDSSLGPDPALGYFEGRITKVNARCKDRAVHLEVTIPNGETENYQWSLDFVRPRLLLSPGEDDFIVLPRKEATKRAPVRTPITQRRPGGIANHTTGTA